MSITEDNIKYFEDNAKNTIKLRQEFNGKNDQEIAKLYKKYDEDHIKLSEDKCPNMKPRIGNDYQVNLDPVIKHQIDYDFYNEYLHDDKFKKIFNERIIYIKTQYNLKYSDDEIIKEFFVEIFSWTVLDIRILFEINKIIDTYVPNGILVDPCSGNSFHTFLFNQICKREVITIDIQPENNAWIKTITCDGLEYIRKMDNHKNKILLLSWIDFTHNELSYNLLKSFKGDIVISIGNYRPNNSKKYIEELNCKYQLVQSYDCIMPWNLNEEIKIFKLL